MRLAKYNVFGDTFQNYAPTQMKAKQIIRFELKEK
jgi:hypothetical protein